MDIEQIRELVELMKENDLTELRVRDGEARIILRRGGQGPQIVSAAGVVPAGPTVGPMALAAPAAEPDQQQDEGQQGSLPAINSPMVGTFYAAADADSAAYVKVGDHVGPETTVCIVEAMKILNHIPADVSGKIVSVLVENGEPVEFGQRMFEVDMRE